MVYHVADMWLISVISYGQVYNVFTHVKIFSNGDKMSANWTIPSDGMGGCYSPLCADILIIELGHMGCSAHPMNS